MPYNETEVLIKLVPGWLSINVNELIKLVGASCCRIWPWVLVFICMFFGVAFRWIT